MEIEKGLDTGAVYARAATPIDDDETAGELRERLVALGTDLLVDTLPNLATIEPEPQVGRADLRRQADGRGVRARLRAAGRRARARRARRQPAAGRVDHRRRAPPEGLARARGRRRLARPPRSATRRTGAHVRRRLAPRPAGCPGPVRLMTSSRLVALDALVRIEDGAYAQVLVPSMLRDSRLRDRDRAFTTDLVYGTVRCAASPRRPRHACSEAPAPPPRPSGARRAAARRVPAAARRPAPRGRVGDRRRPGRAFTASAWLRQCGAPGAHAGSGRRGPSRPPTRSRSRIPTGSSSGSPATSATSTRAPHSSR